MSRLAPLLLSVACASAGLGGCRLDPGKPDYSSHVGLREVQEEAVFLPGPQPFRDGVARLYLGIFYEGPSTHEVLINDVDTHFYIFEGTFSIEPSGERVEGVVSDQLTLNPGTFWGGGILYDTPRDLVDWTTLHVSLRSSDPSFDEVPIRFLSGSVDAPVESGVFASDYGYASDGEWHSLSVPLRDAAGFDSSTTVSPFILAAPANAPGDQLLVDDLYLSQE